MATKAIVSLKSTKAHQRALKLLSHPTETEYMSELEGAQQSKDARRRLTDLTATEHTLQSSTLTFQGRHKWSLWQHLHTHPTSTHAATQALRFFASTDSEGQANYFLEAFSRGIAGADDCSDPEPKILKKVPTEGSTRSWPGSQRHSGDPRKQPSNRGKAGGRGGPRARMCRKPNCGKWNGDEGLICILGCGSLILAGALALGATTSKRRDIQLAYVNQTVNGYIPRARVNGGGVVDLGGHLVA
ncbi:hypothetical protein BJ165DRAFT_1599271 [Panaeolus papilionaceus]|nr:hypothetical protein BJ165DRAFT_1599271 [Panaeolus papilionaceus]